MNYEENRGDINTMKMTLNEITEHRIKENCYLIEDLEGDYLVIYGTSYTEINNGDLYNIISSFLDEKEFPSWEFVRKRLKHNRDDEIKEGNKSKWLSLDKKVGEKSIEVSNLYVDGIKKI